MIGNYVFLDFVKNNYLLIVLFFISIVKIVPPEWSGFWKFNNNKESDGLAAKITPLRFILHNLFDSVISSFLIPILSMFELKKMVTFVILLVVSFNIFFEHQITTPAVTLVGVGIITLYLDKLIETGKNIKLFGGLIVWEKDKNVFVPTAKNSKNIKE